MTVIYSICDPKYICSPACWRSCGDLIEKVRHFIGDGCVMYACVRRCTYITPPCDGLPSSVCRQPRRCQYRAIRLRKAVGETFPAPTVLTPTLLLYPYCGNIDHGKSAQGCVVNTWYTVVYLRYTTAPKVLVHTWYIPMH